MKNSPTVPASTSSQPGPGSGMVRDGQRALVVEVLLRMEDLLGRGGQPPLVGEVDEVPAAAGGLAELVDEPLPAEVGEGDLGDGDVGGRSVGSPSIAPGPSQEVRRRARCSTAYSVMSAVAEPSTSADSASTAVVRRRARLRQAERLVLERVVQLVGEDELGQRGPGGHGVAEEEELLLLRVVVGGGVGGHVRRHVGQALLRLEQAEELQLGVAGRERLGDLRLRDLLLGELAELSTSVTCGSGTSSNSSPRISATRRATAGVSSRLSSRSSSESSVGWARPLGAVRPRRPASRPRRLVRQRDPEEHGDGRRQERERSREAHALVAHPQDVSKERRAAAPGLQ